MKSKSLRTVVSAHEGMVGWRFSMNDYLDQGWMINIPLYLINAWIHDGMRTPGEPGAGIMNSGHTLL